MFDIIYLIDLRNGKVHSGTLIVFSDGQYKVEFKYLEKPLTIDNAKLDTIISLNDNGLTDIAIGNNLNNLFHLYLCYKDSEEIR